MKIEYGILKSLENNLVAFIMEKIKKEGKIMDKNTYKLISKFECCGTAMVTVIIKDKAACIMSELEYNRIIEAERKFRQKHRLKRSA